MQRIKLFGLSLTIALAVCAGGVANASAAPLHIYKVAAAKLEAGAKEEITAKLRETKTFTMKGEKEILFAKVKWEVKCTGLKLKAASEPMIVGGTPGSSEKEVFAFSGCTATLGGAKCEGLALATFEMNNELVTVLLPAGKAGELGNWFVPDEKRFGIVELRKCGIFGTETVEIEGSTAALVVPEAVEGVTQLWVWKEAEQITEIERQSKEKFKPALISGKSPVTLNGEVEVELVTKEEWGAF